MKKLVIGTSAMLLSVAGFGGLANAYPPDTTTTIVDQVVPTTSTPGIPRTGGDIDSSLLLGASAVALGAGLVLVTRRRRRPLHS